MKWIISVLAFLNGFYMLLDGLHVLIKGKYIGPPEPGPWAQLFYKLNINVYKCGPLFIVFGLFWLIWLYTLWYNPGIAYIFGLIVSVLTLWYLPVGTLFSIIILLILIFSKNRLGLDQF